VKKNCKWDTSEEESSSLLREMFVDVNIAVVFDGPPMTQSHQSGALTFHVPWPRLVPIHLFLALAIHLPRRNSERELFL
jgi:hypothetical protein